MSHEGQEHRGFISTLTKSARPLSMAFMALIENLGLVRPPEPLEIFHLCLREGRYPGMGYFQVALRRKEGISKKNRTLYQEPELCKLG